jgi:hypothetical protein
MVTSLESRLTTITNVLGSYSPNSLDRVQNNAPHQPTHQRQ